MSLLTSPPLWFIVVLLCTVQLGFAGYGILLKASQSNELKALIFSFYRDAVATPLLLLAAYMIESLPRPTRTDIPFFMLLGASMFGNQFGNILGLYYTSANIASIFQPAIPVFTALLAIATRIEPPPNLRTLIGSSKLLGILLATGGAIVMIVAAPSKSSSDNHSSDSSIFGYIFLLANTMSMSAYVLFQKKWVFLPTSQDAPTSIPTTVITTIGTTSTTITTMDTRPLTRWARYPVTMTAYAYCACTVYMGFASFYYVVTDRSAFIIPYRAVGVLMYAAFISSALCYGLITFANKHVTASFVTASWPIQVIVTIVLSYFVFGDILRWQQYGGAAMIISGLMAVTWSNHAESRSKFVPLQEHADSHYHYDNIDPILHISPSTRSTFVKDEQQPLVDGVEST